MDSARVTTLEISVLGDHLLVRADGKDALIPGGDVERIPHLARAYMDKEALVAFELLSRVGGAQGVRVTERASE